jgi:hypothetical protein
MIEVGRATHSESGPHSLYRYCDEKDAWLRNGSSFASSSTKSIASSMPAIEIPLEEESTSKLGGVHQESA